MNGPRFSVFSGVFIVGLSASKPALAQPSEGFEIRFQRGVLALEELRYAEACDAFEVAFAERPNSRVLYNLALALRGAGRYRQSIAAFERYLAAPDPGDLTTRLDRIRETVAEMRVALVRVRVTLDPPSTSLSIDGRAEPIHEGVVTLDPGRHVFDALAEDRIPFHRELQLEAGSDTALDASLPLRPPSGRLLVVPSDPSARLSIDGVPEGIGGFDRVVAPGEHRIEITARDHLPFLRVVRVGRTGVVRVDANLQSPARTNWILPTAVVGGVAVLAGSVALIVWVARPSEPYAEGNWGTLRE